MFSLSMPETLPLLTSIGGLVLISAAARTIHFEFFEKYFKLTFEDAPVWSLFYFSAWAMLVALLFPVQIHALFADVSSLGYLTLAFMLLVVFPALFHAVRANGGRPEWLMALYPDEGLLTLGERYILAKVGDVVFQQFIAGVLILTLSAAGVSYPVIVGVFVGLFAAAHLYIFRTDGLLWGLYYTTYAALAGFAFPFLILFVPGGIMYAIFVHMLFYVISSIFFAKLPRPGAAITREFSGA
ncbi:MAG TPA: hypothetical protein VMV62_01220 [Candidatus Paceibacterota bacterium]|nr:hypothetical protein [Candidatus Paceibacterota bacterium]